MNLTTLPKTTKRNAKRLGRGYGSGKGGHTAGRGTKGRKARGKVGLEFDGSARGAGFYKRLPLLRGKGKLKAATNKPVAVNVKFLNIFSKGARVTIDSLIEQRIVTVDAKKTGVKILGDGVLEKAVTVLVPATKSATEKIEKAGGTVGEKETNTVKKESKSASKPAKKSK